MIQQIDLLTQIPVFQKLPPATLQALQQIAYLINLQTGEILFHGNDPAEHIYVVQTGSIRLVDSKAAQDVALGLFGTGEIFALLALKENFRYPARAEAMQPTTVIGLPGTSLRRLMLLHPALALCLMDCLLDLLWFAQDRVRQMAAERVDQRLANAILKLADKFGILENDGITLDLPLSRQDLAELTGTRLETVSRIMSDWEKQGLVRSARMQVAILNLTALQKISAGN